MGLEDSWQRTAKKAKTEDIEATRKARIQEEADAYHLSVKELYTIEETVKFPVTTLTATLEGAPIEVRKTQTGDRPGEWSAKYEGTASGHELLEEDAQELYSFLAGAHHGREFQDRDAFDGTVAQIDKETEQFDREYARNVKPLLKKILGPIQADIASRSARNREAA